MKNFSVDALEGLKFIKEDIYEGKSTGCYELKMPFNTSPDKFGMDGEINIRFLTQMQQSYILIKYLKM